MRAYILTENEREIIRYLLGYGTKTDGIYTLRNRISLAHETLQEDMRMINTFMKKMEEIESRKKPPSTPP
jgi:hypothetical protein